MRKWIKQPNKPICGQVAIAVVIGKSLKEIIKIFGHEHGTKTKELVKVLRKFGYSCPNKLKRLKQKPELAIGKLKHKLKKGWHWVVIDRDKIYDGVRGTKAGKVKWKRGYKITSYLPIKNKT